MHLRERSSERSSVPCLISDVAGTREPLQERICSWGCSAQVARMLLKWHGRLVYSPHTLWFGIALPVVFSGRSAAKLGLGWDGNCRRWKAIFSGWRPPTHQQYNFVFPKAFPLKTLSGKQSRHESFSPTTMVCGFAWSEGRSGLVQQREGH